MTIGIFDSGIGGLSVLEQARKKCPQEDFIFYADVDNVPYGEKTIEQVMSYCIEAADFLIDHGAKLILIACNTATSVAVEHLRKTLSIPVIGMEPAVKKAVEQYCDKRVMVAATPITVQGEKMHHLVDLVDTKHQVDLVALPGLVQFAEKGIYEGEEVKSYLQTALHEYKLEEYGSFVLGCTHFNYFKKALRDILPEGVKFVDGIDGTVNRLRQIMEQEAMITMEAEGLKNSDAHTGKIDYYESKRPIIETKKLLEIDNRLEYLSLMRNID